MKLSGYFFLPFFLLCSVYSFSADIKDFEKHFKLLPQPQELELLMDKGISSTSLQFIFLQGSAMKPVLPKSLDFLPQSSKSAAGVLTLVIADNKNIPAPGEGYVMEISKGQVTITARDQAGLFYACQTLGQLLEDARDQQIVIPGIKITDYPDIAYRAVHLDLKHHLDNGHYYYDIIDRLAAVKINAIIVEMEDKLRYRKSPLVGSDNALSIEEFQAISRYAKDRNIEISPLIQGLGHASFILKHEQYKNLRDTISSDWSFDPMNPETYALQFSLYEDAIAATPYGKYLHIGGDEVGHLGMSELSKKSGLTAIQLQMRWLSKVSEFAIAHHRIPIFWDDMLFKLSDLYRSTWDPELPAKTVEEMWKKNEYRLEENIALFPKECVYMRWNYSNPDIPGNHKAVNWYASHNLKVMAATATQTMWAMLPRENSNFQPIKEFSKITADQKLDGILCTAWDDCSPHFETYFRGFYDFAFFCWNYSDAKVADVHALFRHRFYGPALSGEAFDFQTSLEKSLAFWDTALISKGERDNYPEEISLLELPGKQSPGVWSDTLKTRLAKAKGEVARYAVLKNTLVKALQVSRRNAYNIQLMNQMNELQIYPAKLLLLLEKYDRAVEGSAKKEAQLDLAKYVRQFSDIRKNYENVFSQTRILSNPPSYVIDQNQHHHLANGTANNDYMFVYELAMNEKINQWLPK
ncbi:MAG: glycoside hydrolase family 20 zincin-like fold domain-containing protein [Flavitalea sp.]